MELTQAACGRNIVGYEFESASTRPKPNNDLQISSRPISILVCGAVERLQALGKKIQDQLSVREKEFEDIGQISDVIDTLQSLDKDRLALHHQLEVESITGSSLHHQLKCFPNNIELEVRTAVEAARRLNEEGIRVLQDKIDSTREAICRFEHEKQDLHSKIEQAGPDHDVFQGEHAELLLTLNNTLADKARRQILLNETISMLDETHEKIKEYKAATEETKQEMVLDRVDADKEKENLYAEIEATTAETSKQRRENIYKKREIEELENIADEKEKVKLEKKKQVRKLEKSIAKLKNQCSVLEGQLQRKVKENAVLTQEGVKIVKDSSAVASTLTTIQQEFTIKLSQIEHETKRVLQEREKLKTVEIKLSNEHDIAKASSTRDKNEAEETEKRLRSLKDDLLHQSDECTRLKQENLEMEATLEQIQQNHTAAVEIFNKQIQDASSAVAREKKERHMLQTKRDEIVKMTSDYKSDYGSKMTFMQRSMGDNDRQRQILVEKGRELQDALKRDEIKIADYQSKIKEAKVSYKTLRLKYETDAEILQNKLGGIKEDLQSKREQLSVEEPRFQELKIDYAKATNQFDFTKKNVVDLKNRKATMDATIEKIKQDTQKIKEPKAQLWDDLGHMNNEYIQEIEEHAKAIREVEQDILTTNARREDIDKENARFNEAIGALENDLQFVTNKMQHIEGLKLWSDAEVKSCQTWLDQKWKEDLALDKTYFERDVSLLDVLNEIAVTTSQRQQQIGEIHGNFTKQLQKLFMFFVSPEDSMPLQR